VKYVEPHFPSNPHSPREALKAIDDRYLKPLHLEAKFVAENATNLLKVIRRVKEAQGKHYRSGDFHTALFKTIIKLSKLNRRIGDVKYDELIDECERELE